MKSSDFTKGEESRTMEELRKGITKCINTSNFLQ